MVVGDLMEAWFLAVVEVGAGVGEVVEGVVAHSDCFGVAWILAPGLDSLLIEGDTLEHCLTHEGRDA